MPSLECCHTFTLIKLEETELKIGSIHLPELSKPDPKRGVVMAAGPGRYSKNGIWIPNAVKAGDKVFFNQFAGYITNLDGLRAAGWNIPAEEVCDYRMVQEDGAGGHTDIWAIINEDGTLTALADKVIVELIEGDNMTAGGLYLPETAIKHTRGKVIAVGPGRYEYDEDTEEIIGNLEPIDLQVGDIIYVNNSGHHVELDGKKIQILSERNIGGIDISHIPPDPSAIPIYDLKTDKIVGWDTQPSS